MVWLVVSLRNDDSTLTVIARYVKQTMCWSAEPSAYCVLKAMAKYQKQGRYDAAISTGAQWADKHPEGVTSELIYEDISELYLKKSTLDTVRSEQYLQAISYRDKALRSAWDSPYALQPLVTISESVGDLSPKQRCVRYGNSMKLLDRMHVLADEDKDRLTRQFQPDLAERAKVNRLLERIEAAAKRVRTKSSASGCEKERQPAG